MYIKEVTSGKQLEAEIFPIQANEFAFLGTTLKNGWSFPWSKLKPENTFGLRRKDGVDGVLGLVCYEIKTEERFFELSLLDNARHSRGSKNKRYDRIAGCLISFVCLKAFKDSNAGGFVALQTKGRKLTEVYCTKYGGIPFGLYRVTFPPQVGKELIWEYLNQRL